MAEADEAAQAMAADVEKLQEEAGRQPIFQTEKERADSMAFTSSSYKARFAGVSVSKPRDNAAALTSRLVMAGTAFQVQAIAAEAGSNMTGLRATAAMDSGENGRLAKACIARLEKLIGRCRRKVRDLNDEDLTRTRQKKAQEQNLQKRAERIKQELRKKQTLRAARENAWLHDLGKPVVARGRDDDDQQQAQAAEAALQAEAVAIAAAEVAIEAAASVGGDSAAGAVAPEAGGEPASGGGMDMSV
ncbi:MAG: hypothetical protein GXY32_09520 [Ruminococcaceae bacterium]|nr:hypothetical protein [Oscillospiraceae bacterium]